MFAEGFGGHWVFLPQRGGGAERSEAEGDVARYAQTPPAGLLRFASQTTSPTMGEEKQGLARASWQPWKNICSPLPCGSPSSVGEINHVRTYPVDARIDR